MLFSANGGAGARVLRGLSRRSLVERGMIVQLFDLVLCGSSAAALLRLRLEFDPSGFFGTAGKAYAAYRLCMRSVGAL